MQHNDSDNIDPRPFFASIDRSAPVDVTVGVMALWRELRLAGMPTRLGAVRARVARIVAEYPNARSTKSLQRGLKELEDWAVNR